MGLQFFCKIKSKNTFITNVRVNEDIAYDILFSEGVSEQVADFRTLDGINYNSTSIDKGLFINRFLW